MRRCRHCGGPIDHTASTFRVERTATHGDLDFCSRTRAGLYALEHPETLEAS